MSEGATRLLEGRRGIVLGVANKRSIAWGIAQAASRQGATLAFNYGHPRLERSVRPLAEALGAHLIGLCDVTDDAGMGAFFEQAVRALGGLDFVVHCVAFADRDDLIGRFHVTSRGGFAAALDVSAYSLVAAARHAAPHLSEGGSLLTLSYYGAEKAMLGYNVMGVAKSALESCVRYLAADLGPGGIRVNAISAGPIKTLAAAGVPGLRSMLARAAEQAPLRRNVHQDEVGRAAVFLLSDWASGVTGEVLHVDAGFHAVGT